MSRVWFIISEVRARPNSAFPGPPDVPIYVECCVPESEIRKALDRAVEALDLEGYDTVDVSRAGRLDLEDWDWEEYPADSVARAITERVAGRGRVEIGPFFYDGPTETTD